MKRGIRLKQFFTVTCLSMALLSGCGNNNDPVGGISDGSGGNGGGGGGGNTLTCQQRGGSTLPGNICKFSTLVFAMINDQWIGGTSIPILFPGNPYGQGIALDIGEGHVGSQVVYTGDMEWGDLDFFEGCDENPSKNANFLVTDGANVYTMTPSTRVSMQAAGRIYIGFDGDQQGGSDCVESRGSSFVSLIKCEDSNRNPVACP